jgi:preprotein translocase subunit SecE
VNWFVRIRQFIEEVWAELKKTSWPAKKEVYGTTVVVIITVVLISAYLWVVDFFLNHAVDLAFGRFGGFGG